MLTALHASLPERVDDLRRQFDASQPFRHVVIEPFLDASFCQQLIAAFPAFDARQALSEDGSVGRKAVFANLAGLGHAYRRFDELMRDATFLDLTGRITGIPNLLYDPDYIGGGTHENLHGQELDLHVDFNYHPRTHWHRRLNLILFLNPEWDQAWGGCLELVRDPFVHEPDGVRSIVPLANRAVIFETTESSWHGFEIIRLPADKKISRRSIAVYFYTKERPQRETAPTHSTLYYQRPLPAHIRAGHILTEADELEIQKLLARRDGTIRFLYQRELEFAKALEATDGSWVTLAAVTGSVSFRLGRVLTAPARALRSLFARRPEPR